MHVLLFIEAVYFTLQKCNVSRGRDLNFKRKFSEEEPCQMLRSTPLDAYDALKHRMESIRHLRRSGKDCA